MDAGFWLQLIQIIGIDILLSGDNAVVIALACRSLPEQQRRWGILLGTGAAIALRIFFAAIIIYLLAIPYLKLIGSVLLFWIAIKLMLPDDDEVGPEVNDHSHLWGAVYTILIADAVMSFDNVVGIAAVADGSVFLLVLGLLISIPLMIWGSTMILKLMDRFPMIITLGGALLGYVAADMAIGESFIEHWIDQSMPILHILTPPLGAVFVVIVGVWLARRKRDAHPVRTALKVSE